MKKCLMVFVIAAVVALSGITMAAEKEQTGPKKEVKAQQRQRNEARSEALRQRMKGAGGVEGRMQGRKPVDREEMMKMRTKILEERVAKERKTHEAFVGELKAIKVLAEKEGAKETAKALQKLINKTNKKFEQEIKTRQEGMKRLFQGGSRTGNIVRPRPGAEGDAPRPRPGDTDRPTRPRRGPKKDVDADKDAEDTE